jgi:hypothetical protein
MMSPDCGNEPKAGAGMSGQPGVLVNEAKILAVGGRGADWWTAYSFRHDKRIDVLLATLGGNVAWVPCDSAEDASWLLEWMVSSGVPRNALRFLRSKPSQARRSVGCPHPQCTGQINVGLHQTGGVYACICGAAKLKLKWRRNGSGDAGEPVLTLATAAVPKPRDDEDVA